jgi:hypothetical protein
VTATESPSSVKTRVIPDFLPTNPIAIGLLPGQIQKALWALLKAQKTHPFFFVYTFKAQSRKG